MKRLAIILLIGFAALLFSGCEPDPSSTEASILSFSFMASINSVLSSNITGIIVGNSLSCTVPLDTDLTALVPSVTVSEGATITPAVGVETDFSTAVTYTVTAEDGITSSTYTVTVDVAPWKCDIGDDFVANIGTYSLDGSLSGNTDGLTYRWIASEQFVINDYNSLNTSFEVEPEDEEGLYDFFLQTTDGIYTLIDSVTVSVDISDKLTASDGSVNDYFGRSVSVSPGGSTIVVGADFDDDNGSASGSIYVYSLNGGNWEETKITASDGASLDKFGQAVSVSSDGTTIAVGAIDDDDKGSGSGSVYVFKYNSRGWNETKIIASDGGAGAYFGCDVSVSSDGSTIVVGAFGDDENSWQSGSIYVYSLNGSNWDETKITASDGTASDNFGAAVSVSSDGSMIAVGARGDDDLGSSSGSLYVYSLNGSSWDETKITAFDGAEGDFFGTAVSISSDGPTIAVGAEYDDDSSSNSGSVYIYNNDGSSWNETKLTAADGAADDRFGRAVSISSDGSTVAAGATGADDNGSYSGSAYVYIRDGSSWNETKVLPCDNAVGDYFGCDVSVSSNGSIVAIGACWDDDDRGSAYMFYFER